MYPDPTLDRSYITSPDETNLSQTPTVKLWSPPIINDQNHQIRRFSSLYKNTVWLTCVQSLSHTSRTVYRQLSDSQPLADQGQSLGNWEHMVSAEVWEQSPSRVQRQSRWSGGQGSWTAFCVITTWGVGNFFSEMCFAMQNKKIVGRFLGGMPPWIRQCNQHPCCLQTTAEVLSTAF